MLRRSAAALAAAAVAVTAPAAAEPCKLSAIGTAEAAGLRDGRTLLLADGHELWLAGIDVTDAARPTLQKLVAGQTLRLQKLGADRDRYGRLVAFAFVGNAQESVQQALLAAGMARISARVGDKACAETPACGGKGGPRRAPRAVGLSQFCPFTGRQLGSASVGTGHFTLMEGRVLSVHASGATLCLNFGRRWTRDFSVIILRRNERKFSAAGIPLRQLQGRRIRVRGYIERRAGPIIEVDAPQQIELIE